MEKRTADFEGAVNITANINVNSLCLRPQEKRSGNENNEKKYCQVVPYDQNEANKSKYKNTSQQKEITSKYVELIARK